MSVAKPFHLHQDSNLEYFDLLPLSIRTEIANSPFDAHHSDWAYNCEAIYKYFERNGESSTISLIRSEQQRRVETLAYLSYGGHHPQAKQPNLWSVRRNA